MINLKIKSLLRKYLALLIWFIVFLILMQSIGIAVHEFGHYLTGRLYGCENLSISLSKLSFKDSLSGVSGWETCKPPVVTNKEGIRICNAQTNIISFSGLILTLIIFIPFVVYLNKFLKKKIRRLALEGKFFFLIFLSVISMAITSAKYDLFKIAECLFNTNVGNVTFKVISVIPTILTVVFIGFIAIDVISIMIFLERVKQLQREKVLCL